MKSKIFSILLLSFVPIIGAYCQYVPNGGFENWEERVLYEEPILWNTGNMEAFMFSAATARDTSDSYSGELALRLETILVQEDTLFGYAFCQGSITEGGMSDTFRYQGGIPISAAPDALRGYLKYHIAANDTGIVLASFKREGTIICQNVFKLTGDQTEYTRMEWDIDDMAEVPDTAMVAFACSNPDNPQPGSWLQIDSLGFVGIDDTIPNADFENWETGSYQEPVNWVTANLFSFLFEGDTCATQTSDAHSGNSAIRIEAIEAVVPSEEGLTSMVVGFAMPYTTSYSFSEAMPTFEVDFNPAALTGYYKFDPLLNDTAIIFIQLIDTAGNTYPSGMILLPRDNYQYFIAPTIIPPDVKIEQVTIVASTTIYFMQGDGHSGEVGSVLYLDDLDLINPCDAVTFNIESVDIPTCESNIAVIDAGDGWDEYLWSTGATTQSISVPITSELTYSVTVTDNSSGCQYTDETTVAPPICDAIEDDVIMPMSVELYPNPSTDVFTLEFMNSLQGEYSLEIIAVTGKVISSETLFVNRASDKINFDLSEYPEGLYLIKISGNSFNYCERLMIN